ncbi:MAG: 4Fe-4S dicluster domain-containing protein [Nanoarchaeota archaeon]|nr:4Fe-4S dicluster domain-containing protein [Nanoarchaeota archaeon]MBU1322306.1 4Fe-4S dicluster domain-containing protein [Nanoarchaeota archaeon]MBU1597845.1 4Fe-4S dicluster domain-containing protein [Nanoarchaeota archaeon]MBU2441098.1 4Fe-4S dicluster domain-containing protein [Nanoarchaeota archaeon]
MGKVLEKKRLKEFLSSVSKGAELIAPVKSDTLRFEIIKDFDDICLEGRPLFPVKKFFSPARHDIFKLNLADKNKAFEEVKNKIKPRVIFGGRLCDFNGLLRLDKLFLAKEFQDEYYKEAREKTLLIGINCVPAPSKYCFCESMNLDKYYDLFFHDLGDKYYIEAGSPKGESLILKLEDYDFSIPAIKCKKHLEKKDLSGFYDSPAWKDGSKKCLNCGKCTAHCTTCLCFDVIDEVDADLKKGKRFKEWDSCQFTNFTQVAGGFVFRKDYVAKFKHRIYHKLQYFRERFGMDMCTGCGRCIESCPRLIDFTETVNKLK